MATAPPESGVTRPGPKTANPTAQVKAARKAEFGSKIDTDGQ
jgi:hypothetical protein